MREGLPERERSFRKLAQRLKLTDSDAGLLCDVVNERHGHVSHASEDKVRKALGLPSLRDTRATLHVSASLRDEINANRGSKTQAEFIEACVAAWLLFEEGS